MPNEEAARGFREIAAQSPLPLVADIHFDYKLAIAAAEGGAAKIRINPGNIGGEDRVQAVVEVCKSKHIPIRIGVNGGSLDKKLLEKYGHPTAEALVESAFSHLELLEKQGFYDTCVSMKSSTVPVMVAACRLFRQRCDYPLHIGVTETGPVRMGMIKSAMGIGALLLDGIGETVRVSLTADPVQEVYAAKEILRAAGLRKEGVNIISCPTCGRTSIDLIGLVAARTSSAVGRQFESAVRSLYPCRQEPHPLEPKGTRREPCPNSLPTPPPSHIAKDGAGSWDEEAYHI